MTENIQRVQFRQTNDHQMNSYPTSSLYRMNQPLIKSEHQPVGSGRKLGLLLQRSARYSYRDRCCKCCPTIICELLIPIILILFLLLSRFSVNLLNKEINRNPDKFPSNKKASCSLDINQTSVSAADLMANCFNFSQIFRETTIFSSVPGNINSHFIFHPNSTDIHQLVTLAQDQLTQLGCLNVSVRSATLNDDDTKQLLSDETINNVIIDFGDTKDLTKTRTPSYTLLIRQPDMKLNTEPVDLSFLSFGHPSIISDRSTMGNKAKLPNFSDVKIFIDSLVIRLYTGKPMEYDFERTLMTCTPYRNDSLYDANQSLLSFLFTLCDFVFLVPYFILLSNLLTEKNAKVKEILKILGIQPILNNFAHAIRTMIIFIILTLLLSVILRLNLKPDGYFNYVNFITLFLMNIVIAFHVTSLCILNGQLFEVNVRAVIVTIIFYILSVLFHSWSIRWPQGIQYILMMISPFYAYRSLLRQLILYDLGEKDASYLAGSYTLVPIFLLSLVLLLISSIIFWIFAWYFEKIFPGKYGTPMPWNFFIKNFKSNGIAVHRTNKKLTRKISLSRSSTPTASIHPHVEPILHIENLVKKFGPDKTAVNDVSFDLYPNQITSLLGPNGSGKTTIFNCLTGIHTPTSGSITVKDNEIDEELSSFDVDKLRKSIGYCPQHDILFDLLTVEEQLEFYAVARGYGLYKKAIASELLDLVNLRPSRFVYCKSLSGGMKRRLSLACAFVGDTKIVLLDEPSSGLDPSNRRALWDWLRTMKQGKTLLLTTHFMEESDALSDRIIIITNGVIQADGTSAKLKEDYGSGYKIVINKRANYSTKNIERDLRKYLPRMKVETDLPAGDVVFQTNQQPDESFVQALRLVDNMKRDNLINSYGVQNSTMDDVFLRITRENMNSNGEVDHDRKLEKIDKNCRKVFHDSAKMTGFTYYLSQWYGLIVKNLMVRYRRWIITTIVLLTPIIYQILSNVISGGKSGDGTYQMRINSLNPQTIIYHSESKIEKYFLSAIRDQSQEIKLDQQAMNISAMNQYIYGKRNEKLKIYTENYLAFDISSKPNGNYKIESLSSNLIAGYEPISVASNTFMKHALNDTKASIQTTLVYRKVGNYSLSLDLGEILDFLNIASCFLKLIPVSLVLDVLVFYVVFFYISIFLISERKDSFLSLLNISGLHPTMYWISNYVFDLLVSVLWLSYLLLTFSIIDTAFNGVPSSRKEPTGLSIYSFASSWDLRIQFYSLTIIIAMPTLPFVYLLTKIFKNDILGSSSIVGILIILHFVSIIVPIVTALTGGATVRTALYWLFNIISPTINSQAIVTYIMAKKSDLCRLLTSTGSGTLDSNIFTTVGDSTIWVNWLLLFCHIFILLFLLIMIDSGLMRYFFSRIRSLCFREIPFDETQIDNDVKGERRRVLRDVQYTDDTNAISGSFDETGQDDHLVVQDLVKKFSNSRQPAVNHLTFGAKRGEAFGLLGYNGAGKTTTFRILVGDEIATQGSVFIDGQNIKHRLKSIRQLGYCPQQDCSMDYLNVEDGLRLLARIRGVYPRRIPQLIDIMTELFLLEPYRKNYIHQLSGGTKRRLHAALALIGPPSVAILDEPTTGVDPDARQQMQEIFLSAVKSNLTIILTSHSMDECERVCNRLGIMVTGQFACLGTIQHLKTKFGKGYTIDIKTINSPGVMGNDQMERIKLFLTSQKQLRIEVRNATNTTGSFQMIEGHPADLFELLEQQKNNFSIETYTISQTTLEQIFLSFGKRTE